MYFILNVYIQVVRKGSKVQTFPFVLEEDGVGEECVSDRSSTDHTGNAQWRPTSNDVLLQPDTNTHTRRKKEKNNMIKTILFIQCVVE